MLNKQIHKTGLILTLFALATTAVVTLTHIMTAPKIAEQQRLATLSNLQTLIPAHLHDNDLTSDCTLMTDHRGQTIKVYRARKGEHPIAAAMDVIVPDGYSGRIDLLAAMNTAGIVMGVRTIKHEETPGLGDKIEIAKSDWITIFSGKEVLSEDDSRWAVRKDGGAFDQFTGATITPRAIVKGIKHANLWFKAHQDTLFTQPANCGDNT